MEIEWVKVQKIVLGYIFKTAEIRDVQKALTYLQPEYFSKGVLQDLWQLVKNFYLKYQSVVSIEILRDVGRSKRWSETRVLEYEEMVQECIESVSLVDSGGFVYYVEKLVDIYKEMNFSEIMAEGVNLLHIKGFISARDLILTRLSALEKTGVNLTAELDIGEGMDFIINSVREAKLGQVNTVNFGIPSLDNMVLGLRSGDFVLVAGFTEVGKTSFCVNMAIKVAFEQKKNVVYITTETVISTIGRRVVARLSKLDLFENPVMSSHLKSGQLTSEENDTLLKIKDFFKQGDYGHLMIVQAPVHADLNWLRGKLLQYESSFKLDLVILDDLRNMKPLSRRRQEWEEFNDMLKECKNLARTHAGRGVPVVSPYQISREGYKNYLGGDSKRYKLTDLSSSSEAERSPDVILSLWADEEVPSDIKLDVLKLRDGAKGRSIQLRAEFDYQNFYEVTSGGFGNLY